MNRLAAAAAGLVLIAAGAAIAQVRPSAPPANTAIVLPPPVTAAEMASVRNDIKQLRTDLTQARADLNQTRADLTQARNEAAQLRTLYLAHVHTYPRGDDGSCAQTAPKSQAGGSVAVQPPQSLFGNPCQTSKPVN